MKIEVVLLLYDALMRSERISRRTVCAEYCISERTFYRYMREVTDFLRKYKPEYVVDLSRSDSEYFAVKLPQSENKNTINN